MMPSWKILAFNIRHLFLIYPLKKEQIPLKCRRPWREEMCGDEKPNVHNSSAPPPFIPILFACQKSLSNACMFMHGLVRSCPLLHPCSLKYPLLSHDCPMSHHPPPLSEAVYTSLFSQFTHLKLVCLLHGKIWPPVQRYPILRVVVDSQKRVLLHS